MSEDKMSEIASRVEILRRVGRSAEADRLLAGVLTELEKVQTNLIIEIDMGPFPFFRNFATDGFHREHPLPYGLTKFEVKPVVKPGDPAVGGEEMLILAKKIGCDMDQQSGDRVAEYLNSKRGAAAFKALRDAGYYDIVLPNERDFYTDEEESYRYVPILHCGGERWVSGLDYLDDDDFGSDDVFLVPC